MKKAGRTLVAILMTALIMGTFMVPTALIAQAASGDTVEIATKAEFEAFRDNVNAGYDYYGETVVLTANISLAGRAWEPIGGPTAPFKGTFIATGYTISYMNINIASSHQGLFGFVAEATITDVTLANATINGHEYLGGIVAFAGTGTTVSGCSVSGRISGSNYIGGIVGYADTTSISGCSAAALITGTSQVGGTVGSTVGGSVTGCTNTGSQITASSMVGGIGGYSDGTSFTSNVNSVLFGAETVADPDNIVGYEASAQAAPAALEGANWSESADTSWYNDTDTTFSLSTAESLAGLAQLVNAGNTFAGKRIELANSIYLNNGTISIQTHEGSSAITVLYNGTAVSESNMPTAWTAIGAVDTENGTATPFCGTFDGMGNTVGGIYINNEEMFQGFFGMLSAATVTRLNISNSFISGGDVMGGICANAADETLIENCSVQSTSYIEGINSDNVGGVCGDTIGYDTMSDGATITGCNFYGLMGGNENVGGIVGIQQGTSLQGSIESCTSTQATVFGNETVGGIAGSSVTVSNCTSSAEIICENGIAGGITGSGVTVTGSTSSGEVTCGYIAGGIVGINDGTVTNSDNTGSVNGNQIAGGIVGINKGTVLTSDNADSVAGASNIGGIVGYNSYFIEELTSTEYTGTVTGCMNNGTVSATADNAGGIAGYNSGIVETSDNTATVSGKQRVGGIVGSNYYANDSMSNVKATIDDCDNMAQVGTNISSVVGGIAGDSTGDITNCINTVNAPVIGSDFVGGISGHADGADHCENNAVITGTSNVGGIAGSGSDEFLRCANSGNVSGERYIGGVCGSSTESADHCTNNGDISGVSHIGGITGYSDNGDITHCVNSSDASVTGLDNIGGIIGYGGANIILENTNDAVITGTSNVGGIAGYSYSADVDNCINSGIIEGESSVGGIMGHNEAGTLNNSFNDVAVSGNEYVGGIIGTSVEGTIEECYNTGAVVGETLTDSHNAPIESDSIGGIVGYSTQNLTTIALCYNDASITGDIAVGGILGNENFGSIVVEDCYNKGNVTGEENIGGLIGSGSEFNLTIVQNNFSMGQISGECAVGGAVGIVYDHDRGIIEDCDIMVENIEGDTAAAEELIGTMGDPYYEEIVEDLAQNGETQLIDKNYHMVGTVSGAGNGYSTEVAASEFTNGELAWLLNTRGGADANGEYVSSGKWSQNGVSPQHSATGYHQTYKITITGDYTGNTYSDSDGTPITLPHGYTFTLDGASFTQSSVVTSAVTIVAHAHSYTWTTNNNGTHSGVCSCGDVTTQNCEYDSVVTPPTCTENGYTTNTCRQCGYVLINNTVPATGHIGGTWVEITDEQTGETYEAEQCTVCGHIMSTRGLESATVRTVTFVGMFNKVISKQQVNTGENVDIPQPADVAGYTFTSWNVDANADSYKNRAGNLTVTANYELANTQYTVTINGESNSYEQFTTATAVAPETKDGKQFSNWIDEEGRIVSYYANYSFTVHADTTLTAVYGAATPEPLIAARVTKAEYNGYYDYLTVYVERSVDNDYTVVQHGMLITDDATIGSSDTLFTIGEDGIPEGVSRTTEAGGLTGLYTLSFDNLSSYGEELYMRSYVKVTDGNQMLYVYSAVTTYINPMHEIGPAIIESGVEEEIISTSQMTEVEQEAPAQVEEVQQFANEEVDEIDTTESSFFARLIEVFMRLFSFFFTKKSI